MKDSKMDLHHYSEQHVVACYNFQLAEPHGYYCTRPRCGKYIAPGRIEEHFNECQGLECYCEDRNEERRR